MKKFIYILFVCILVVVSACAKSDDSRTDGELFNAVSQEAVLTVTPSISYQPVVGFGGMYNPKIWLGSNLLTDADMNKLYGASGLGYSILRLMIYPRESDWGTDVAGARIAQQNGALVFACPWDCTEALDDKTHSKGKHLDPGKYQEYTDHLVKYINYMKANGVNLYAISMQNEPDMNFTYWTPAEVVNYMRDYGAQIRATGVKLMAPEACGMQPAYTDPVLNDAVAFANTDIVAGHLYQGFTDLSSNYVKNRHDYITGLYNSRLAPAGKTWWMTEHLFNDGADETDSFKWKFRTWDYCISNLAKEIHMTMDGYCSAYVYWYLKRFYGMMGDNDYRTTVPEGKISKNGYILSHYAKYATGTTRIKVNSADSGVLATAYKKADGKEITLVVLNTTKEDTKLTIMLPAAIAGVSAVQTTKDVDMQETVSQLSQDGKSAFVLASANGITSVRLRLF
ncbi:glycoside hydrolase family 30 beta sandwich domain-containing protein [Bacteroides ovatus]|uniref:glycoside hydrolase family 30 beta sandwich domain-containing protein n=1 Tax=Bacteroides ovatus TaxID=28116 RepID=UPI001F07E7D1|nr:glycoside hydrolase family 30 beta sandwich domain-containing protein [Bacteroides ovatus]